MSDSGVNKWIYFFAVKWGPVHGTTRSISLCRLFWSTLIGIFFATITATFVLSTVVTPVFWYFFGIPAEDNPYFLYKLFSLFAMLGLGIAGVLAGAAALIGLFAGIKIGSEKLQERINQREITTGTKPKPLKIVSMISQYIKARKEKFCPTIRLK